MKPVSPWCKKQSWFSKRKLQTNVLHKRRGKHSKNKLGKLISTIYKKDTIFWLVEFRPRIPGFFFHIWKSIIVIHHVTKPNKQTYDHLNKSRKTVWQKPTPLPGKMPQQSSRRKEHLQPDEPVAKKTYS